MSIEPVGIMKKGIKKSDKRFIKRQKKMARKVRKMPINISRLRMEEE